MSNPIRSWFHSTPSTRPLDNSDVLSKILKIVLATLGIIASFTFFTAEIAIIATLVIFGVSYVSLQRINNVYYRTVSPRPLYQRIFPFWTPIEEPITPSYWPRWSRIFSRQAPEPHRWFWQTRAPIGTGRPSPIMTAPPAERPTRRVSFEAPTTRREDSPSSYGWFGQTRAPVATGRPSPIRPATLAAQPTCRTFVGASTTRREDSPRGTSYREPTRARVGERRR